MWHTILITVHAVTATSAAIAGLVTVVRSRLFATYLGSLIVMELSLIVAVLVQWTAYTWSERAVFTALALLGAVVVWQGLRAWQFRPTHGGRPSARYLNHTGFTLIALCDAFLVVTVVNAGAPTWAVAATGIGVALTGHLALRTGQRWIAKDTNRPAIPA